MVYDALPWIQRLCHLKGNLPPFLLVSLLCASLFQPPECCVSTPGWTSPSCKRLRSPKLSPPKKSARASFLISRAWIKRASTALGKSFTFLLGLRRALQTRALTRFVADRARSVIEARAATYRYCSLYGSHLPTTQADPSRSRTGNSIQTKEIRLSHPPRGWPMANQFNSQFDFYTINFFNFIFCFLTFKVWRWIV